MSTKITKFLTVSLLTLSFAGSASLAHAWTAPTVIPPGANVDEPINAGDKAQIKTGDFTTLGLGMLYDLAVAGYTTLMGNVGIGEVSPTAKLHLVGIDATSSNFALKAVNSVATPLLFVRNDGNVGIGTTDPKAKLDVRGGNARFSAVSEAWSEGVRVDVPRNSWGGLRLYRGDANYNGNWAIGYRADSTDALTFTTNNEGSQSDVMQITKTGNVGIGTTDPGTSKLKVEGELKAKWIHSTAAGANTFAGNVGIGTGAPHYLLDFGPAPATRKTIALHANSAGNDFYGLGTDATGLLTFWTNNTQQMSIGPTGNVSVVGDITAGGQSVCRKDGTNCPASAAAPTYSFSDISGAATDAQIPDSITVTNATYAQNAVSATNQSGGTVNATTLIVGGVSTLQNVSAGTINAGTIVVGTALYAPALSITGPSTIGTVNATTLGVSGTGTFGTANAATLGVSGTGTFNNVVSAYGSFVNSLGVGGAIVPGGGGIGTTNLGVSGQLDARSYVYLPGTGVWDSVGRVGIGTRNPLANLSVGQDGDANTGIAVAKMAANGGPVYGINATAIGFNGSVSYGVRSAAWGYDFYAAGPGIDYGAASSIRWKENIKPIDSPLDKISKLRGVYFDWKKDKGGKHDVGMIAEEVRSVLPEIVQSDKENPEYAEGMDYSKISPLLVEAIKEQQKEIENLKQENNEIKALVCLEHPTAEACK